MGNTMTNNHLALIKDANNLLDAAVDSLLSETDVFWLGGENKKEKRFQLNSMHRDIKDWVFNLDNDDMRKISINLNIIRVLIYEQYLATQRKQRRNAPITGE